MRLGDKKISNPSRTTKLEERVSKLENDLRKLTLLIVVEDKISIDDTEEEKRLRALREKGVIKYGD